MNTTIQPILRIDFQSGYTDIPNVLGRLVLIEPAEAELSETLENCFGQNSRIKLERDSTGLAILATVRVLDF